MIIALAEEFIKKFSHSHLYISQKQWYEKLKKFNCQNIGNSRNSLPLYGINMGNGPCHVSMIAGCHADEPVGPVFLWYFIDWLHGTSAGKRLLQQFTFWMIPQMNPDGCLINKPWMSLPLSFFQYCRHVVREAPGDDVEFSFPSLEFPNGLRKESLCAAAFFQKAKKMDIHFSFHSMSFAGGVWTLLDVANDLQQLKLCEYLSSLYGALQVPLYDVDRQGEKGFYYLAPGFSTAPSSTEMKKYFYLQQNSAMASKFSFSSMEFMRQQFGDVKCVVSEVPNFYSPLYQEVKTEDQKKKKQKLLVDLQGLAVNDKKDLFFNRCREEGVVPFEASAQIKLQFLLTLAVLEKWGHSKTPT